MRFSDPVAKHFVEAVVDLRRRQLWRELHPTAAFLIRHPDEPHRMAAVMPNADDKTFVFLMYRGPLAFTDLVVKWQCDPNVGAEDLDDVTSVLGVGFSTMRDLIPSERQIIRSAKFRAGSDGLVPFAFSRLPRRLSRVPTELELRVIADCARAILATRAAGEFCPKPLNIKRARILEVAIELGDGSQIARARMVRRPMFLESRTPRRKRGGVPPASLNGSDAR